ncbi:hypothetical protein PE066_18790 [Ramlibacter tataouinensis]|uniref:hypothetical protein n=1 Tax=Ramlibacter tataouinensis TaxID=94132 RepID=UPI0022F4041B|nr:hypothetical protein [Ramlibacter tataouinensis]WBY01489.1 hypothetical protein PE066_18790 [Ramlibacter tataouinensis]
MSWSQWRPLLVWLAAAVAAVTLAWLAPHERQVLGKLPSAAVQRLAQLQKAPPWPRQRVLALVVFDGSPSHEVQGWIEGLQLQREPRIAWVKLPVVQDPGDDGERRDIERRLRERWPAVAERSLLLPVFTDRAAFVREAGLSDPDHASVLVIDGDGNVLARAQGPFDPHKAQALRETVLAQNDD